MSSHDGTNAGSPNPTAKGSRRGTSLWSELQCRERESQQHREQPTQGAAVYLRRRLQKPDLDAGIPMSKACSGSRRVSVAHGKRSSFTGLSTRGRVSFVIETDLKLPKQIRRKNIPRPGSRAKGGERVHPDFTKEKIYFQEIDSLELLEESPSPKHFNTWTMGRQHDYTVADLHTILARWRISKRGSNLRPSQPLLDILEAPALPSAQNSNYASETSKERTPSQTLRIRVPSSISCQESLCSMVSSQTNLTIFENEEFVIDSLAELHIKDIDNEDDPSKIVKETREGELGNQLDTVIRKDLKNLHLVPLREETLSAYAQLLMVCEQSVPVKLLEVFSKYCDPSCIVKIGEGTYGEAFRAGDTVCKVVPIDGSILVNGEAQKKSEEVLEEVLLSITLNSLREPQIDISMQSACASFIETKDFQVCQGAYDSNLINAWEDWDAKFQSENDHPKEFPKDQLYIIFVLADGGKDLESFVLQNIFEAQSVLVQVTAALAAAEAACEFEHRDLHWGNILLACKDINWMEYTLEGRKFWVRTHGIIISIIDFTLSRINTGKAIHFLDISSDPAIFDGPKGDKQSETYRKMREVTEECWEESFPKTNVLWLMYLVDILLTKKHFKRSVKDERELRSLKKRMNSYSSAIECLTDTYFMDQISETLPS